MAESKSSPSEIPHIPAKKKKPRTTRKMYEALLAENAELKEKLARYREVNAKQLDRLVGEELYRIQEKELKAKIAVLKKELLDKES